MLLLLLLLLVVVVVVVVVVVTRSDVSSLLIYILIYFESKKKDTEDSYLEDNKVTEPQEPPEDYYDIDTLNSNRYTTVNDIISTDNSPQAKTSRARSSFTGSYLVDNPVYVSTEETNTSHGMDVDKVIRQPSSTGRWNSLDDDTEMVDNEHYVRAAFKVVLPRFGKHSTSPTNDAKRVGSHTDPVRDDVRHHGSKPPGRYSGLVESRDMTQPSTAVKQGRMFMTSSSHQTSTTYDTNWRGIRQNYVNDKDTSENVHSAQRYELGPLGDVYNKVWKLPRF